VNSTKCAAITFSTSLSPIIHQYVLNGNQIERSQQFRDLGVIFDVNCKFVHHLAHISRKAYRMLGFLIRSSRWLRDLNTVIFLYNSLVRSQLEYACQIWNPFTNILQMKLEAVQRRFSRFVFRKFNIPYTDYEQRLYILELESLQHRRNVADLLLLYKIVNGTVQTRCIRDICIRRRQRNIRNMELFGIRTLRHNISFHSPLPRMMRLYNRCFMNEYLFNLSFKEYVTRVNQLNFS